MHLAGAGRIGETNQGRPMREDRNQSRGHRKGYYECKEQLHGIPDLFPQANVPLRQFG
jgi:hypothetical protein